MKKKKLKIMVTISHFMMILSTGYYNQEKEALSTDPSREIWHFQHGNHTKSYGLTSLPGDLVPGHQNSFIGRMHHPDSHRLQNGIRRQYYDNGAFDRRLVDENRIYMEDDSIHDRNVELSSMQRHEYERGSDRVFRNSDRHSNDVHDSHGVREQHFYRDGNAEVLRLVSRGEVEDLKVI